MILLSLFVPILITVHLALLRVAGIICGFPMLITLMLSYLLSSTGYVYSMHCRVMDVSYLWEFGKQCHRILAVVIFVGTGKGEEWKWHPCKFVLERMDELYLSWITKHFGFSRHCWRGTENMQTQNRNSWSKLLQLTFYVWVRENKIEGLFPLQLDV